MKVSPLLLRSSLLLGESVPSLMERLRVLNGYQAQRTVYSICREHLSLGVMREEIDAPLHSDTYQILSELCQLPPLTLYRSTTHSFESCLQAPDEPREQIELPSGEMVNVIKHVISTHHLRPLARMAFCPLCLRDGPYHRTLWQADVVTVCLEHQCLLRERCIHCRSPQPIAGIVADQCVSCGRPLSSNPAVPISDEQSLLTASLVQGWLTGSINSSSPLSGLSDKPVNVLYRFLDGLRWCLLDRIHELDRSYLVVPERSAFTLESTKSLLSIEENHVLFSTAMKGLLNWPNGFCEFLTAYNTRKGALRDTTLEGAFGLLTGTWLNRRWRSEAFDFIQQAFNDYLLSGQVFIPSAVKSNKYRQAILEDWHYVTVKDAANKLGVGENTVKSLLENGTLHEIFPDGHRPFRYHLVLRREVERLKESWYHGMSLSETAEYLGLSEALVAHLANTGKIEALRKPQEGSAGWLFTTTSVESYLDGLFAQVSFQLTTDGQNEWIDLTRAAQIVGPVGGNALTLLERISSGKLPVYMPEQVPNTARNLLFASADIYAAVEQIKVENDWYDASDIASLMHLKRTVIDKWIEHGLLIPVASLGLVRYFSRTKVDAFISEHVFIEEAAKIMHISTIVARKWVRGGRLKAVSGIDIDGCHRWLLVRAQVENFRPENRYTAPEMAEFMGIRTSQFMIWIKQGKVKPVSGPGIDGMAQYLFLRDGLNEIGK